MKLNKHYFLSGIFCLIFSISSFAQDMSDTLVVYFRTGSAEYVPSFSDNRKRMEEFVSRIHEFHQSHVLMKIMSMEAEASTSPDGTRVRNEELADQRVDNIQLYLRRRLPFADSSYVVKNNHENWEALRTMVSESDLEWKDDVLDILDNVPLEAIDADGNTVEQRKMALMAYQGGRPWRYMLNNMFPQLRSFVLRVHMGLNLPVLAEPVIEFAEVPYEETEFVPIDNPRDTLPLMPLKKRVRSKVKSEKVKTGNDYDSHFVVKTNGIGWALFQANGALEVCVSPRFSVNLPVYYSGGINYFKEKIKFRGVVFQPEARFWFKEDAGWFIGAHLGMGWYNFALNGDYRIQDRNYRPALGGGFSGGYKLPFKKDGRMGLEFSLGAGAYHAVYDKFYNEPNGAYAETNVRKVFIGIDNAAVSFYFRFGSINKEGRQ